jgi:hypothetical protein
MRIDATGTSQRRVAVEEEYQRPKLFQLRDDPRRLSPAVLRRTYGEEAANPESRGEHGKHRRVVGSQLNREPRASSCARAEVTLSGCEAGQEAREVCGVMSTRV